MRPLFRQVEAIALHLGVKKLPMNSKEASGFRTIAGCLRQSATNQHLLKTGDSRREIFFQPIVGLSHCDERLNNEAKIASLNGLATRKDSSAFHCVLELPDIARPCLFDQQGCCIGREPLVSASAAQKMLGQGNNIRDPLPQRRQMNRNDMQPIKKILPEAAFTNALR